MEESLIRKPSSRSLDTYVSKTDLCGRLRSGCRPRCSSARRSSCHRTSRPTCWRCCSAASMRWRATSAPAASTSPCMPCSAPTSALRCRAWACAPWCRTWSPRLTTPSGAPRRCWCAAFSCSQIAITAREVFLTCLRSRCQYACCELAAAARKG